MRAFSAGLVALCLALCLALGLLVSLGTPSAQAAACPASGAPTATLKGVLSEKSGNTVSKLSDIQIEVDIDGGSCGKYVTTTGAGGSYSLSLPAGHDWTPVWGCVSGGASYVDPITGEPVDEKFCDPTTDKTWAWEYGTTVTHPAAGSTVTRSFTLVPWASIKGTLVNGAGKPITSGVTVSAAPGGYAGGSGLRTPDVSALDSAGRFTVSKLTPGAGSSVLVYSAGNTYRVEPKEAHEPTLAGGQAMTQRFVLAPYSGYRPRVTLSGYPAVGQVLTGSAGPGGPGGSYESDYGTSLYRWLRDGRVISGANGQTYRVGSADIGHAITFQACYPGDDGGCPGLGGIFGVRSLWKGATTRIGGLAFSKRAVHVRGHACFGQVMRVVTRKWRPRGTHFTFQWYRSHDGAGAVAIRHGAKRKLKITKKLRHSQVAVHVTARKRGYATWTGFVGLWRPVSNCR